MYRLESIDDYIIFTQLLTFIKEAVPKLRDSSRVIPNLRLLRSFGEFSLTSKAYPRNSYRSYEDFTKTHRNLRRSYLETTQQQPLVYTVITRKLFEEALESAGDCSKVF